MVHWAEVCAICVKKKSVKVLKYDEECLRTYFVKYENKYKEMPFIPLRCFCAVSVVCNLSIIGPWTDMVS